MDSATLQNRIYKGYAKAAQRIGPTYTLYRPSTSTNPIVPGNVIATLPASFNAEDMTYKKPNKYGHPVWYCLVDGTQTRPGDYLVNGNTTYFIAAMQLTLPIIAVDCNRRVRIGRMPPKNIPGDAGYSGVVESQETDVLGTSGTGGSFVSGWPASILMGGRSDKDSVLPSGVKSSGVVILLPPSVPIVIKESDMIQDDLGREYAIYTAEQTDLGWRIQANEEHS